MVLIVLSYSLGSSDVTSTVITPVLSSALRNTSQKLPDIKCQHHTTVGKRQTNEYQIKVKWQNQPVANNFPTFRRAETNNPLNTQYVADACDCLISSYKQFAGT